MHMCKTDRFGGSLPDPRGFAGVSVQRRFEMGKRDDKMPPRSVIRSARGIRPVFGYDHREASDGAAIVFRKRFSWSTRAITHQCFVRRILQTLIRRGRASADPAFRPPVRERADDQCRDL